MQDRHLPERLARAEREQLGLDPLRHDHRARTSPHDATLRPEPDTRELERHPAGDWEGTHRLPRA